MWFQNSISILAYADSFTFSPVPFQPPIYTVPILLVWCNSQQMVRSMLSTVDPEARQHQATLQSTMQAFVKLMRSEEHHHSKYVDYIKDMKFLVDSHVPQLLGWELKDVAKNGLDNKSETQSASTSTPVRALKQVIVMRAYLISFDTPCEGYILTEFPKDMLMTEVRTNISSVLEHIDTSHTWKLLKQWEVWKSWSPRFQLVHSSYYYRPPYSLA